MNDVKLHKLIEQAKSEVCEVLVEDAYRLIKDGKVTILDIREPEQVALGYIDGSIFIRGDELEMEARHLLPDKKAPLLLYCGTGKRSLFTALELKDMGYADVRHLDGGFQAWKAAGYEVMTDGILTLEQLTHFSRQIIIREIGVEGQRRLLGSKVLLVGAGGLGSSAGLYLAASGIGTLGIVDFDKVDKSNLNRQVIHGYADIGRAKVESAADTINRLNPEVEVVTFKERLSPHTALNLISQFDIVLDCSDNFPAKYLINDACFFAKKPYIFGAAVRFEGQASFFNPKDGGPCLRCMWPTPPQAELAPT
jgi:molybdopterin/thiamine biosynthesis adenylyltransferase/rhodanese-related sulfurtransferase